MQHIRKLRILTNSLVRQALLDLPRTLDETYDRMLLGVGEAYRGKVRAALQWLAFIDHPIQLNELIDICGIDVDHKPHFSEHDRKLMSGIIDILASLIVVVPDQPSWNGKGTIVALAHFSVKEYLVSSRIKSSPAKYFALNATTAAHERSQCCCAYLLHVSEQWAAMGYGRYIDKIDHLISYDGLSKIDHDYPLLYLATTKWHVYQSEAESTLDQASKSGLELVLLRNEHSRYIWCLLRLAYSPLEWADDLVNDNTLWIACLLTLPWTAVRICLGSKANVNTLGSISESPLTSSKGFLAVVEALLVANANPDLRKSRTPPLFAACCSDAATRSSRIMSSEFSPASLTQTRYLGVLRLVTEAGVQVDLACRHCKYLPSTALLDHFTI